jgi:Plasmid pRiA4b ORF-3-like protein
MRTTRLRVTLRDVEPLVTRVIDVPNDSTLPELHELLQAAMGWTNSHLHQFDADGTAYGVPDDDGFMEQQDEAKHKLKDLSARFTYLYDFGDGWEHDVDVLGTGSDQVGCVFGEGACPPEDCGGPHGYEQLLMVLADPQDPEHESMRLWAGELRDFDQADTDLLVRQTVGQVPDSVRLILSLAEGGVKLTPGGRLPRAFVRQVQQARPHWAYSPEPASIEEDLLPLTVLHFLLRQVGLLRLRTRILTPTKAAADDLHVVRRLRSWCEPDDFFDVLTSVSVALLATRGPMQVDDLAALAQPFLGHRWAVNGQPMTVQDVKSSLYRLHSTLEGLDLMEADQGNWAPGPSARTLIPGATALAHLWSKHPADQTTH